MISILEIINLHKQNQGLLIKRLVTEVDSNIEAYKRAYVYYRKYLTISIHFASGIDFADEVINLNDIKAKYIESEYYRYADEHYNQMQSYKKDIEEYCEILKLLTGQDYTPLYSKINFSLDGQAEQQAYFLIENEF